MNPADKKLNVFISSTYEDLKDYRAVAHYAILQVGWVPVFMELFGAMPGYTVEACREKLEACDLMVLLVAFRRGWVPTNKQGGNGEDSITALEFQWARKKNIPALVFLAQKNWPNDLCEDDDAARAWYKKFRNELNQVASKFEYENPAGKESDILPAFRAMVYGALVSHKEKLLEKRPTPAAISTGGMENLPGASRTLLSGKCIPLLGHGVYGKGPLSICALRKALGDESCKSCDDSSESCTESCLATAAEFQDFPMPRYQFLEYLKEIVKNQAKEAKIPPVYDLVQQIKPPLIVSATLDLLLEKRLWNEGKQRCLILCHAIRSEIDAGKILVFQGPEDDSPKLYPANDIPIIDLDAEKKLPLNERAYIVYKPLGSPLLSSAQGIDTVVITEEDYSILLRRLGSQETGVPLAFTTCFKNNPPIFLGYPMDVWHYRLMGQVFKSIPTKPEFKPFFAVRKTNLPMEKKAWEGPGINLVPMDLNEFSQKVKEIFQKVEVTP
ncbi:MAG: DUF4062 domain-containing protein [Desulfobaccales bacterium]